MSRSAVPVLAARGDEGRANPIGREKKTPFEFSKFIGSTYIAAFLSDKTSYLFPYLFNRKYRKKILWDFITVS